MANWLTHLRIAEKVMQKLSLSVDIEKYFVGSVAPDSSTIVYDENGKQGFNPSKDISHWSEDIPDLGRAVHYERFYDAHFKDENNFDKKSFFLGYYIHLITDAIWSELVARPVVERFINHEEYLEKAEKQFRSNLLDVELIFLMNNSEFRPLELLKTIKTFNNIYLDYFSPNAFEIKIQQVIKTYQNFSVNPDRIFPYCSYEYYEQMITLASNLIVISLLSK